MPLAAVTRELHLDADTQVHAVAVRNLPDECQGIVVRQSRPMLAVRRSPEREVHIEEAVSDVRDDSGVRRVGGTFERLLMPCLGVGGVEHDGPTAGARDYVMAAAVSDAGPLQSR